MSSPDLDLDLQAEDLRKRALPFAAPISQTRELRRALEPAIIDIFEEKSNAPRGR